MGVLVGIVLLTALVAVCSTKPWSCYYTHRSWFYGTVPLVVALALGGVSAIAYGLFG